ncbi:MAG TPA: tetratricopeptide repeat protein [Thermoanaerobaculia bacterium]
MTRDNVLFIVIGILIGFISGYLMHEVMAARQPARLVHGDAGAAPPGGPAPAPGPQPQGADRAALTQEIRSLEQFVAENPDDAEAALRLANLSFEVGDWTRCAAMYERRLELLPGDPDVLSDLGVCYRELGQADRALAAFDRAQEIAPGHWQSRFNEVVVLAFDQRDFEAAERVLDELRNLQPGNPDVEALAAEVARRRGTA